MAFSNWLDKFCRRTAVGFFSIMLLLVVFQVIARYLFQSVPVWTEEAARYCMVWGGLLGATAAFKSESDPRLIHPPQSGSRLKMISAMWARGICVAVFLGPILYHSDRFLMRTWQRTSEALGISIAWVTLAVPASATIILFHLAAKLLESTRAKLGNDE